MHIRYLNGTNVISVSKKDFRARAEARAEARDIEILFLNVVCIKLYTSKTKPTLMAKILVTGSTGFIGKRLIYRLLEQGHEVYAVTRIKGIPVPGKENPHLHTIFADFRDLSKIDPIPQDIDAAYYLMHSMGTSEGNLLEIEIKTAENFLESLKNTQCKQVIYLSGIIEDEATLSPHLYSRLAVERVLCNGPIPCTVLRSSIIIGCGSASFEIIRDLVEKLPIMVAPKWVKSMCQPISISDVLYYLTNALLNPACYNAVFDIGGPEALSFKEVLLRYAAFRKLRRWIIDVPVLTPRLSSYWLVFITSVRFSICSYLVDSMKQNTRKLNTRIDEVLPHSCQNFEKSLAMAFQQIAQNEVVSTWMDAWDLNKVNADVGDYIEVPQEGCLKDERTIPITIPFSTAKERLWSIGGRNGWYSMYWAWRLRGLMDKFVGGAGLNRGRRHPTELVPGDSIDFWRVLVADEEKGRLVLYAEMKLPGEAWLEFELDKNQNTLRQAATFRPKGFLGRAYWYSMLPFHMIIFRNMAKAIAQKIN